MKEYEYKETDAEIRHCYYKDGKPLFDVVYDKTLDPSTLLQPERSKREDIKSYDDFNLECGCHEEPGMFSLHSDCKIPEHINYQL